MSTLGKVLLFVNILAAAGVFYFATQDYAKRQQLNEFLVKYSLVLNGIDVDAAKGESASADTISVGIYSIKGNYTVQPVAKKLLDGIFSGANGEAFERTGTPTSQMEELLAVSTKLNQQIDSQPSDAKRIADLCGVNVQGTFVPGTLMNLSETFEERLAIRKLALAPSDRAAANVKDARDRLKRKFDAVTEAPNPEAPDAIRKKIEELRTKIIAAPRDNALKQQLTDLAGGGPTGPCANDQERRLRIAQLLMQLSPAPNWQKRVALLVGLKTYQAALTEQAGRMELMAQQTRDLRFSDQSGFDAEYEQLGSLALEQSKLVDQEDLVVRGLKSQLAADEEILKKRSEQLRLVKEDLAALTASVNQKLADQAKVETALFEVQRQVGLILRETGRLEQDLRKLEVTKK